MHLKPAKYTTPEVFSNDRKAGGLTASAPVLILDSTTNNNNYQFTASDSQKATVAAPASGRQQNAINAKLDKASRCAADLDYNLSEDSKELSALESLPINYNNNAKHNNRAMNFNSKYDQIKLMELSIINLVELSSLSARQEKITLALDKAREALEGLNSLKILMAQDTSNKRASGNSQHVISQPMTTGVRLFELSLMVNSNLAAQFRNNGLLNESLELYTQLCKMANSTPTTSANQQQDSKYLLYRFGLNIGNLYYDMKDYQHALKYYRLTLDRLSSAGSHNLRMKLMNNIAVTLLDMRSHSDAITSFNLLLSDNLSTSQAIELAATSRLNVCNSNHQRFALNLIVCYYKQANLSSMMSTMKDLVKVDICHQYERVFDLDLSGLERAKNESAPRPTTATSSQHIQTGRGESSPRSATSAVAADIRSSAHATARDSRLTRESRAYETNNNQVAARSQVSLGATSNQQITNEQIFKSRIDLNGFGAGEEFATNLQADIRPADHPADGSGLLISSTGTASDQSEPIVEPSCSSAATRLTKLSAAEKTRQVMSCIQEDTLEMLIGEKRKQIARCLIMAANLLIALDNRERSSGVRRDFTAIQFCLDLFAHSDTYKQLVDELKANVVSGMIKKRHKLDKAIAVFREIELNSGTVAVGQRSTARKQSAPGFEQYNIDTILNSPLVAANLCLFHLLQHKYQKAMEYADVVLKEDKLNVQTLVNLANCHYHVNDFNSAETLYQHALRIDPSCWQANYNLALVHRKLNRHYNDLNPSSKASLARDKQCFSALISRKMILSIIQLALM